MIDNPLLNIEQFPDYDAIKPSDALPAIETLCENSKSEIENILVNAAKLPASWGTYNEIEAIDNKLSKAWSPISHLHSVMNNDEWRDSYQNCQQIISMYGAEMSQHTGMYNFYISLRDSESFSEFNNTQKKIIIDSVRDFELSGVNLSDDKKAEYQKLVQNLSELQMTFSNNLLDATQSFHIHITDKNELAGIPDSAIALYQQLAEQNDVSGYWITLDFPSYYPAMCYAENQQLRKNLYHAYVTRASDVGPNANEYNNAPIIEAIMSLRSDLAELLGFKNYADMSLANKMAKSPKIVLDFLYDLVERSKPIAEKELSELQSFAKNNYNIEQLNPWDITYYAEKLKEKEYAISQEELRAYFPVPKVMDGLFSIVEKLFNVSFKVNNELSKWTDEVQTYSVINNNGQEIAYFYIDLYARQGKNGGAWMNGAIDKINSNLIDQKAVAYLTCNFIPPAGDEVSYLSHDEIVTLFHEFGHGLHHMLTKVNYSSVSGINGVEWDAVELPSQFMENFCFQKEVLENMSSHKDSKQTLPDSLFKKLTAAKNFQSAMMMVRQLEFSIFDMEIHHKYNLENPENVMDSLNDIREKVAVTPSYSESRFPMSFSHIFSGGYSAGYFSYKWAEVLSADAFAKFEEEGIYNKDIGALFKSEILERGSSRTALENFTSFRGRAPNISALLRHNGIINNTETA